VLLRVIMGILLVVVVWTVYLFQMRIHSYAHTITRRMCGLIGFIIIRGVFVAAISVCAKRLCEYNHKGVDEANPPRINASSDANSAYLKDDAYSAAKTFASRVYPGAKSFSSRDESPVVVTAGAIYSVTLVVDGVNAFNAPVRNVVLVTEVQSGDHWRMLNIEQ